MIDNAIGLADQVGIPVPDGDTEKIDKAAQAWDRLATVHQTKSVVESLEVNARAFSDTRSPEVEYIARDLRELKEATSGILDACADLSQSCKDYGSALDELRHDIEEILKDLAIELGATAAIGVAASFVTFGVGAVAATAKAAHTITKFAKTIGIAVAGWKLSKNIAKGVQKVADVAKVRQKLERIKNIGRRSKNEEPPYRPSVTIPNGAPKNINGYTKHAEEQIAGRDGGVGVRRDALEDAFNNPVHNVERLVDQQGRISYRYTGEDATVVVNEQGKVITGWANNSRGTGGTGG